MYHQYMCILLYVKLMWCKVIPYINCQLEWRDRYPQYMCILVYVKLILCNSIPYINCQLEFGRGCILSVCAFCSMRDLLGVMVFHRSFVNWIVRYMYCQYMCILLYVKLIWCNGILESYCELEFGG